MYYLIKFYLFLIPSLSLSLSLYSVGDSQPQVLPPQVRLLLVIGNSQFIPDWNIL